MKPANNNYYIGDNGPATGAFLKRPRGLAVSAAGDLYITDVMQGTIRRVDGTTGLITTPVSASVFSDNLAQARRENFSSKAAVDHLGGIAADLALDRMGNLYFAGYKVERQTPPIAIADTATTTRGTPVVIDVLANDVDVNASGSLTVTNLDTSSRQGGGVIAHVVGLNADGSGTITATDALIALRTAVGLATCQPQTCDVNSSMSVTATDALQILRVAVGLPGTLDCPPAG